MQICWLSLHEGGHLGTHPLCVTEQQLVPSHCHPDASVLAANSSRKEIWALRPQWAGKWGWGSGGAVDRWPGRCVGAQMLRSHCAPGNMGPQRHPASRRHLEKPQQRPGRLYWAVTQHSQGWRAEGHLSPRRLERSSAQGGKRWGQGPVDGRDWG